MVDAAPDSDEIIRLAEPIRAGDRRASNVLFGRHRLYMHRVAELCLDSRVLSQ